MPHAPYLLGGSVVNMPPYAAVVRCVRVTPTIPVLIGRESAQHVTPQGPCSASTPSHPERERVTHRHPLVERNTDAMH